MKAWFLLLALVAISSAEPPAPQYSAPSAVADYMSPPPSSNYGAPSSQYGAPSSQYGAPSSQYGAPSSQYGAPAPSSQYGAPSSQYGAPSSQYGAPQKKDSGYRKTSSAPAAKTSIRFGSPGRKGYSKPSAKYGAPSALQTKAIFASAPSQQYGAPSQQYGAPSQQYGAPSQQYGAPAQQYGAPSSGQHSSGNGGYHSAPSAQYGAPAAGNGGYSYGKANKDDDMSEPASYQFKYEVKDEEEGAEFGHEEEREGDEAKGEYRVLLPDGRTQVVTYTADERGYLPEIRFEEAKGGYGRGPQNGYY
ncbi:pro-resilin-like [Ischnura elegans]|uniref:pro-resilin-like n=1 Tax=Ischnura elegans TaxID=197161 RepID=UPI001ED88511|nr:pro-resilin-like [Ischnura elegans]